MITLIKYGKTINTGDYNSERIDAEYMVGENECPMGAMEKLKKFVSTGVLVIDEVAKPLVKQLEEVKKTTAEKVEEDISEDAPKEVVPAKKATKKVAKKAAKKAKKVAEEKKEPVKKPDIAYDRAEKTHKSDLLEFLISEFRSFGKELKLWPKEEKDKAISISKELEGDMMYNHKGQMLESFKESIIDGMTA